MRKKKIAIVGAGNAAVATALHYYYYGREIFDKIAIYYDPSTPIERVGQGSVVDFATLIGKVFDINFYNKNIIQATRKDEIYHAFSLNSSAIHYVPKLLSKLILESGLFNVVEKRIINPEEEIDADFIFDCRGKHNRNNELYNELVNPLNHVILSRKDGADLKLTYTRCVATPDGWTFVIPNHDSVSYGYLFNDTITDLQTARTNFIDLFDVVPDIDFHFDNYIAKKGFVGEKTLLNGNKLCFLEPLEATSISFYLKVARFWWDHIVDGVDKEVCNQNIHIEMNKLQTFVQWHYQFGSKYNTPFWDYAKSLPFNPDEKFNEVLDYVKQKSLFECKVATTDGLYTYSQWNPYSFKVWQENI
jgi:hypothetical protein